MDLHCRSCGIVQPYGPGYYDDDHPGRDEDNWLHLCIPCYKAVAAAHEGDTDFWLGQMIRESEKLGLYDLG